MTTVTGMFGSVQSAERAKAELNRSGIADHRITLSINLTADPIAGEYPGQTYENQADRSSDQVDVGEGWTDTDRARYAEEVRSAACVVSVRIADDQEEGFVAAILRREGARRAISRPDLTGSAT